MDIHFKAYICGVIKKIEKSDVARAVIVMEGTLIHRTLKN
jgi:hypothetical protein